MVGGFNNDRIIILKLWQMESLVDSAYVHFTSILGLF